MPASNCTSPPYPKANPITIFGSKTPLVRKLHKLSTKVVSANELNPNGIGLANLCAITGVCTSGWNSLPKAGSRPLLLLIFLLLLADVCARGPYPNRAAACATWCSSWDISTPRVLVVVPFTLFPLISWSPFIMPTSLLCAGSDPVVLSTLELIFPCSVPLPFFLRLFYSLLGADWTLRRDFELNSKC